MTIPGGKSLKQKKQWTKKSTASVWSIKSKNPTSSPGIRMWRSMQARRASPVANPIIVSQVSGKEYLFLTDLPRSTIHSARLCSLYGIILRASLIYVYLCSPDTLLERNLWNVDLGRTSRDVAKTKQPSNPIHKKGLKMIPTLSRLASSRVLLNSSRTSITRASPRVWASSSPSMLARSIVSA